MAGAAADQVGAAADQGVCWYAAWWAKVALADLTGRRGAVGAAADEAGPGWG